VAIGDIVLGPNQYGKAEVRLVRVTKDTAVHVVEDLNVTTQLRGDFAAAHTEGDNAKVLATDTQKNTVYAFAREHGIGSTEAFLLRLAEHFGAMEQVHGATLDAESYAWERIRVDGAEHDHAFVRSGREVRTATVDLDGATTTVRAGLEECTILKSARSEFHGFPRDRYTTLPETDDRILATSLTASWRYAGTDHDWNALYDAIRDLLLATFAERHSLALQQTIYDMGRAVLEAHDEVAEISLSCPNKHHFLVDLAPFGLDNPGEVFFAADRPYGLIEATVLREGA
jgi:urate oxidase